MAKKNTSNQKIHCDVNGCIHNDADKCCCELNEIKVSCNCPEDNVTEKKETICESFECNCGYNNKEAE